MGRTQDEDLRTQERNTAGPPKWSEDPMTPPPYDDDTNPRHIEHDIDHVRAEMDETIDALSARLQPRMLIEEALGWAGLGSFAAMPSTSQRPSDRLEVIKYELHKRLKQGGKLGASALWAGVKRHPLPSAVIAAGVAWAIYEETRPHVESLRRYTYNPEPEHSGSYVDARTGQPYHEVPGYGRTTPSGQAGAGYSQTREAQAPSSLTPRPQPNPTYSGSYVDARTGQPYDQRYGSEYQSHQHPEETEGKVMQAGENAKHNISTAANSAKETAEQTAEHAKEAAHKSADKVRHSASHAAHTVQDQAHRAAESARRGGEKAASYAREGASGAAGYVSGAAHKAGDAVTGAAHSASDAAHRLGHAAYESASHTGERLWHQAEYATSHLSHAVSDMAHNIRCGAAYSRDRAWQAVQEHPLAVGAAALGVGLLIGMALPATRRENEIIGERADRLRRRAREAGWDMVERGRGALESTASSITEELEEQGLTPDSFRERAQNFAQKVVKDVKEDAREEGLTPGEMKKKAQAVASAAGGKAKDEASDHAEDAASKAEDLAREAKGEMKKMGNDVRKQGGQ